MKVEVIHNTFGDNNRLVASYEAEQGDTEISAQHPELDNAFRLTNSIDSAWFDNQDLTLTEDVKEKGGARSTSVDDIVSLDGQKFVVAMAGFEPVASEELEAINQDDTLRFGM